MQLARDIKPVPARSLELRLLGGLAAGTAVAFFALLLALGVRGDLSAATLTAPLWIKVTYAGSIGLIAIAIAAQLARPDCRPRHWYGLLVAPVILLAITAAIQLATNPATAWPDLVFGMSAKECIVRILGFSLPVFAGLIWSFRGFAPTNLRAAGAAAGLVAGAVGAGVYIFYCREVSASFVLFWYTLGMSLPAIVGALLGPRLLRW